MARKTSGECRIHADVRVLLQRFADDYGVTVDAISVKWFDNGQYKTPDRRSYMVDTLVIRTSTK